MRVVWMAALLAAAAGCGRQDAEQRRYTEVSVQPARPRAPAEALPTASPPMAGNVPRAPVELTWTVPEGWEERPGSGMRLATFLVSGHDCSLTAFPGDVGGAEANLRRWAGQISATDPPPDDLRSFMANAPAFTSAGGMPGRIFDFRALSPPEDDETESMLAAILERPDSRVFAKLTAPASVLLAERDRFEAFCRSLDSLQQ